MRKIFSLILICAVMLFSGCSEIFAPENNVTPPFFMITDPESGNVAYLLGTMHTGLANTVYPDDIYTVLGDCSALAVEIDLFALEADQKRLSEAMALLECDGENARDFMGDDYAEIKRFFQKIRLYNSAYDRYIPAMWSAQLSNKLAADCGYDSRYGTDRAMLSYAKQNGIDIVELETVEEQYGMNAAEPRNLQTYMLLEMARTDYEEQKQVLRELYAAWSTNDASAIKAMLAEEEVPDELSDEYDEYYNAMYTDRQRKMADYIASALENGDMVLVAVGAMHCYAEPSILDFLDEKGYIISDVYSHETNDFQEAV